MNKMWSFCFSTPSIIYLVWIDGLMLNTQSSLSIKGQWCEPMSKVGESIIDAYRSQGTKIVSKTNSWMMSWCRQE